MKREDLTAQGLTAEQVEFVMSEYGKEVNPLKAERDSYKTQLDTAQASLKAMEGVDAAELQRKITDLTTQLQGKDTEIEKIKTDYAFETSVKDAIRKASGMQESWQLSCRFRMRYFQMQSLTSSEKLLHVSWKQSVRR